MAVLLVYISCYWLSDFFLVVLFGFLWVLRVFVFVCGCSFVLVCVW